MCLTMFEAAYAIWDVRYVTYLSIIWLIQGSHIIPVRSKFRLHHSKSNLIINTHL